jgi:hypothetical protein
MSKNEVIKQFGYTCSACSISEWMGKPICLELDHIDGNNRNNELSNLRLLCPNCHSQTETFRGRNINKGETKVSDEDLVEALTSTKNIRQALIKVGLTPKGMNYQRASKLLNHQYQTVDKNNSQYGSVWIHNGTSNKKIKADLLSEYLEQGWVKGRIMLTKAPSQRGKFWVTNGLQNRMVTEIPEGWWKGMC